MLKSELKIVASRLAKHFKSDQSFGPCACVGLECYRPDCPVWWEEFLTLFNAHDVAKMVEAYIVITGYPQLRRKRNDKTQTEEKAAPSTN